MNKIKKTLEILIFLIIMAVIFLYPFLYADGSGKDKISKLEDELKTLNSELAGIKKSLETNSSNVQDFGKEVRSNSDNIISIKDEIKNIKDLSGRLENFEKENINISKYTIDYASIVISLTGLIVVIVNSIFLLMGYLGIKKTSDETKDISNKIRSDLDESGKRIELFKSRIDGLEKEIMDAYVKFLDVANNKANVLKGLDQADDSLMMKTFLKREYDKLFKDNILVDLESDDEDVLINAIYHAGAKKEKRAIKYLQKILDTGNISSKIKKLAEDAINTIQNSDLNNN